MFDYCSNARRPQTVECTQEIFLTVIRSTTVSSICAEIKDALENVKRGAMSREDFETYKRQRKIELPAFLFQAHFRDNRRHNSSAIPSGLSIFDIDHLPSPEVYFKEHVKENVEKLGIVLAHVTPSTEGLRLVFVLADGETPQQGQKRLAAELGITQFDEACKDLARCSFAVPEDYVLFIDKDKLFANHNSQNSWPSQGPATTLNDNGNNNPTHDSVSPSAVVSQRQGAQHNVLTNKSNNHADADNIPSNPSADAAHDGSLQAVNSAVLSNDGNHKPQTSNLNPQNLSIFDETVAASGLTLENLNNVGTRHNSLITILSMGICRLMPQEQLAAVIAERMPEYSREKDCQDLIRDFYAKYTDPGRPMSGKLRKIYTDSLKLGKSKTSTLKSQSSNQEDIDLDDDKQKEKEKDAAKLSAKIFKLLPRGLKDSLVGIPDTMRMPVLCSILPLAGAYADGVTVRYCDGQTQRLNLMSIIVGPQASGKSACKSKVDLWMRQMEDEDSRAREIEDKWKQAKKSKKANEKAPEDPCVLIRSVPVTISCSTLLRRFKNSRGHCLFSFGEELDTLRKTNGAGSWSSKYDIYRLGFDNGKWGQDYNSDQAESGVVQVAYNFSILGTYGALRKCFRGDNVENGLSSRIIVSEMPDAAFAPMPVFGQSSSDIAAAIDRAVTLLRSQTGFIDTPKLRKAIGKWVEDKRLEAMADGDLVRDTYRKRAAVIGFRCGVIARLLEGKECKAVLEFATMMAQYVLDGQCRIFGESLRNEYKQAFDEQKRMTSNGTVFDTLPPVFTLQDIQQLKGPSATRQTIYTIISRWKKSEWIEKVGINQWKKNRNLTSLHLTTLH